MAVDRVAGSSWNQWPDADGLSGRMARNTQHQQRNILPILDLRFQRGSGDGRRRIATYRFQHIKGIAGGCIG